MEDEGTNFVAYLLIREYFAGSVMIATDGDNSDEPHLGLDLDLG